MYHETTPYDHARGRAHEGRSVYIEQRPFYTEGDAIKVHINRFPSNKYNSSVLILLVCQVVGSRLREVRFNIYS